MRLIFMGTPEFALVALKALAAAGHDLAGVYTQPPRRAGRGKALRPSPVQVWAEGRGLPGAHPGLFRRTGNGIAEFTALKADAAIVAAYGLILPQAVLDAPVHGCLNIHASLLPRWRGAAPIQRAIQAGDAETGITIMQMDAGLDTGPILMQRRVPITDAATAGGLHDELAALGAEAMAEVLAWLDGAAAGDLAPRLQPGSGATYARKIDKSEARIDWSQPAAHIERTVRAFDPAPGAFFDAGGQRIRVLCAELAEGAGAPGTVLDGNLTVACGEGALRPLRVQRQGKAPMAAADLLRGFAIPAGTILS